MCEKCKEIRTIKYFYSPKEYLQCLSYIDELINSGEYMIVSQTCEIERVRDDTGKWQDDIIEHVISCKKCGRIFKCTANTYRGGGSFMPID